MPLTQRPGDVSEDERIGISFYMSNGTEEVVVWVDKGALSMLRNSTTGSERAAFERRRVTLESIASANYDAGIIEPDGTTIIRRDDVEGLI